MLRARLVAPGGDAGYNGVQRAAMAPRGDEPIMSCPNCGVQTPEQASQCPACGVPLAVARPATPAWDAPTPESGEAGSTPWGQASGRDPAGSAPGAPWGTPGTPPEAQPSGPPPSDPPWSASPGAAGGPAWGSGAGGAGSGPEWGSGSGPAWGSGSGGGGPAWGSGGGPGAPWGAPGAGQPYAPYPPGWSDQRPESSGALAGWWQRVGATVIDGLITAVISLIALGGGRGAYYAASFLITLVYTTVLLVARGQTVGMMAVGTRVVQAQTGARLTVGPAVARWFVEELLAVTIIGGLLDILWPLWDSRNQTLHDKVANSLVVRTR